MLFFSLTFIIIFAAVTSLKFLTLRVEWAKILPAKPETTLTLIIAAAHWAMSLTLFSSILITLNYIVRKRYFPLISIIFVMGLSFAFCFGISFALEQWKSVPPAQVSGVQLGEKGLILSSVVLLEGTADPLGPRVMAIPNQPLVFHESAASDRGRTMLPPVPFGDDTPWFLESVAVDIRINAQMFQRKFAEGFFPYLIYSGSIIFLLCSLGFAIKFSVWPLANLFLATLAFRGILALVTFFNTPEMQEIIGSFLDNKLQIDLAIPIFFTGVGLLIHLYSFLVYAVKRRVDDDN